MSLRYESSSEPLNISAKWLLLNREVASQVICAQMITLKSGLTFRSGLTLLASQVICAQMITAGGALLARLSPFAAILVDEVAQVMSPTKFRV